MDRLGRCGELCRLSVVEYAYPAEGVGMPPSSESDSNALPRLEETEVGSPMGEPRDDGGGERRLTGPERTEGFIGALRTLRRSQSQAMRSKQT